MLAGKQSRRVFLRNTGVITAGSLLVPAFLNASAGASQNSRRLVVIQLSGGNDGLNTIIPYRNDELIRVRPTLLGKQTNMIKVTDEMALNPGMNDFRSLWDSGDVCIVNQVGYPNSNRSHFRSMDIWQSASDADEYLSSGWLGRYLDSECSNKTPVGGIEVSNSLSLAMRGDTCKGIPVRNIPQFYKAAKKLPPLSGKPDSDAGNPVADFLNKTIADTRSSAQYLFEKVRTYRSTHTYPNTLLGGELRQVAQLIMSGVEAPVFYVSLSGFDTHSFQQNRHQHLLEIYSESVKVFADHLKSAGEWSNTTILTFSEFGRRLAENASGGTDHGKANTMFVMGGSLKSCGLYNSFPDLVHLDDGDPIHSIDFRQVYATVLDTWLGADSFQVLGNRYDSLDFF